MRNRSKNQIKLVMIRHGATNSNREHRYLGKTEESLCREAAARLRKAAAEKVYPQADLLFSSPMKRCLETAALLYPHREPVIIFQWEEMDFGDFEGKNYVDLQGDVRYQAWIDSGGTLPFPRGESREDFMLRCQQGLSELLKLLEEPQETAKVQAASGETGLGQRTPLTVAAIVHGGTIMSLLSRFYGGEYFDYQAPNGGGYICTLEWSGGEVRITELQKIETEQTKPGKEEPGNGM